MVSNWHYWQQQQQFLEPHNQRKSISVWYNTLHWKTMELDCCARRFSKSNLDKGICQHCGMETSAMTPSFYYVFNVLLSCEKSITSFIGNLWQFLLLGNYLKLTWKKANISHLWYLYISSAQPCLLKPWVKTEVVRLTRICIAVCQCEYQKYFDCHLNDRPH